MAAPPYHADVPILHIAVIGGGISGLASAFRLADQGHRVTLFESSDFLGGLGTTFPYDGGHLERFYHCILPDDEALLRLIHDVGLDQDLLWRRTDMGFMYDRTLRPLNTPLDLLRFSPLALIDRIRMGLLAVRSRFRGLDPGLDSVAVSDWLRGQVGDRAFEVVWKPLLEAKIGDGYSAIPALWLSSRMHREKSTKLETKGCLRRGYRSLIDALAAALEDRGVRILLERRVDRVVQDDDGMGVVLSDGTEHRFDTVVATSPLIQFQDMTRELDIPESVRSLSLDYQGVISGVFLLRAPLSRYYWMPIVASDATAQGVIEMSNLVPLYRSNGLYVTYFVNYTHRTSDLFAKSDDELLELYQRDLERLFPDAAAAGVADRFLFRAPFVEPLWPLGYAAKRPPHSIIPGRLYLTSTAQIYPHVNSWNSCTLGVETMMESFTSEVGTSVEGRSDAVA